MRKSVIILILAALCLGVSFEGAACQMSAPSPSQSQPQLRTVEGQVLTSTSLPAIRLKFDKDLKYIGSQDFILYDVARAEQHFFVDAEEDGRIKRIYWVQFEGYLPSNTRAYRYKTTRSVKIGPLDFIADALPRNIKTGLGRPDSDGNRAADFLKAKGYRMGGDDILTQRLVHLIGEDKRNELMIIYMEDLNGTGFTAADLAPGGRAASRWDEMSKGLLERAVKGIEILP